MIALALLVSAVVTGAIVAGNQPVTYIYKRGDNHYTRLSGPFNESIDQMVKATKKYGNEFVWLRKNGRNYVIRDAATLAEVRNAFREVEAMEPSLREVERRLKPFEREMEKIEERVDALGDSLDDEDMAEATRDSIEARLRDAEKQLRAVEAKANVIEREMEKLEHESERLEQIAEKRFEAIVERAVGNGVAERVE